MIQINRIVKVNVTLESLKTDSGWKKLYNPDKSCRFFPFSFIFSLSLTEVHSHQTYILYTFQGKVSIGGKT